MFRHIRGERVIGVGSAQEGLDREEYGANLKGRGPFVCGRVEWTRDERGVEYVLRKGIVEAFKRFKGQKRGTVGAKGISLSDSDRTFENV